MERGSKDNITVIIVDISPPPPTTGASGVDRKDSIPASAVGREGDDGVSSSGGSSRCGSSAGGGASGADDDPLACDPSEGPAAAYKVLRKFRRNSSVGKSLLLKSQKPDRARAPSSLVRSNNSPEGGSCLTQGTVAEQGGLPPRRPSGNKIRTTPPSRFKSSPLDCPESHAVRKHAHFSTSSSSTSSSEGDEDEDDADEDEDYEAGGGSDSSRRRGGESGSSDGSAEDDDFPSSSDLPPGGRPDGGHGYDPSSDAGQGSDQDQAGGGSGGACKGTSASLSFLDTDEDVGSGDRDTVGHCGGPLLALQHEPSDQYPSAELEPSPRSTPSSFMIDPTLDETKDEDVLRQACISGGPVGCSSDPLRVRQGFDRAFTSQSVQFLDEDQAEERLILHSSNLSCMS